MKIQNIRMRNLINDTLAVMPASFLLSFTFFVFGPLQMYLTNASEFWFKLKHILPTVIVSFFVILTITIALYHIMSRKIKKYYVAMIFGIGLALYLQGNYINLDYGVMDGSKINWSSYGILGVINTVIWVICVVAPAILTIKWPKQLKKVIIASSLFIVAIQVVTVGVLLLNTDTPTSKQIIVTRQGAFSLSPEKNEIIFILDTFDASYMNELLKEYPEYKELFSDFTYYDNVLGTYPTTRGALPHILTGVKYDNSRPYSEYINYAYDKTILYDTLRSKGYDIGLYTSKSFISPKSANNFINIAGGEDVPESNLKLGLMMYKSTAFSYFPHVLKKNFWYYSGDFNKYIDTSGADASTARYSADNIKFYNSLVSEGLSSDNESYAFRLYHLNGVHTPYTMTADITYDKNGTSAMEASLGSLNIVLEYIDQLKMAGIYDNTSIIIIADHGKINMGQNPILMVKQTGIKKEFSITSAPVSFDDLLNTMLYLSTDMSSYQPNIFTWKDGDVRTRQYMHYSWDNSWNSNYLPDIYEYVTTASADDVLQMQKTGKVYSDSGIIENFNVKVNLGEELVFGNKAKIQGAIIYGFSTDERTHIWSIGNRAKLTLVLDEKLTGDKLAVAIRVLNIYGSSQRMKCYINGKFIDERLVKSIQKPIIFEFPSELVPDSGIIELELEYPDAYDNAGPNDQRILTFAFGQITFDYVENLLNNILVAEDKVIIDFSENGNSNALIDEGWYGQEAKHRWASEKADIKFYSKSNQNYLLAVEYQTYKNSGDTHIIYNGQEIACWESNPKSHTENIALPAEYYNDSGIQTVTFITDDAKSPLECGVSKDARVLGIDVKSISIEVNNEN